jgi:hypothetical protein
MVKLGMLNSRMKDFWDLRVLLSEVEFDGAIVQEALQATFACRQTPFPTQAPLALTDEFSNDKSKQMQWCAFLRKNRLDDTTELREVIELLQAFFLPLIAGSQQDTASSIQWKPIRWVRE